MLCIQQTSISKESEENVYYFSNKFLGKERKSVGLQLFTPTTNILLRLGLGMTVEWPRLMRLFRTWEWVYSMQTYPDCSLKVWPHINNI